MANFLMNYYRAVDRSYIQFDFAAYSFHKENYYKEIEAMGGTVYRIPHWKRHPLASLAACRRILRGQKVQILHAHESVASLSALFAAFLCGTPIRILHSHNARMEARWKDWAVRLMQPLFKRYTTHFCACSSESAAFLFGERQVRERGALIIPNAIDTAAFRFDRNLRRRTRSALGIEGCFALGHVGRMSPQKNQLFLLDIFYEVKKQREKSVLLLAGKGEDEADIRQKAQSLGLAPSVFFLGMRTDVPALLSAFDVFVLPSVFEGFPVAAVEAQAAGLPCVFSGAVTPAVDLGGVTAFLSLSQPPAKWADEILRCASRRTGARGAGVEEYDVGHQARRLEKWYAGLIGAGVGTA